jgi:hypothetical protein
MPYFNSPAIKYGLAMQYYSEQHNSISELMWLVVGQPITGDNQTLAATTRSGSEYQPYDGPWPALRDCQGLGPEQNNLLLSEHINVRWKYSRSSTR